jgi:uncharacterized protein (TIGR03083 family)
LLNVARRVVALARLGAVARARAVDRERRGRVRAVADADPFIGALRACHDHLVTTVAALDQRGLTRPSACDEWDVAELLGHLGSGAEIGLGGLDAARSGTAPPARDTFPSVWARWDAMSPEECRDAFVAWDERLVAGYESLDDATRTTLRIKLGFLPSPMDVPSVVGFRLSESALHSWDVRVGTDPDATLDPPAAELLVDRLPLSIGFFAHPDALPDPITVAVTTVDPTRTFALSTVDAVTLQPGTPASHDGTLTLGAEALIRLVAGRLLAPRAGARLDSDVLTIDDLCRLFPGY